MVAVPESPLPLRNHQGNINPRTPQTGKSKASLYFDDIEDDYGGDTIPCSPSAALGRTQPTQILSRPALSLAASSSPPPRSVVEVPASSPFRNSSPPAAKPISRLAPAGTVFRPPPARAQPTSSPPRPSPNKPTTVIELSSDEETDTRSPNANIRPTEFKKHIASFAYQAAPSEERKKYLMRSIYDVFGNRFSADQVRNALQVCKYDLENTITWLETISPGKAKIKGNEPSPNKRKFADAFSLIKASARREFMKQASPPKKPRRRLIQGRRKRSTSPVAAPSPEEDEAEDSDDLILVDVKQLDKSKMDEFQAEESPEPEEDEDDRVLNCVNTSTIKELAAMTGLPEANLEPIIEQRPFRNLNQARKAHGKKSMGRRSSYKTAGDAVVSNVGVFLSAVAAVDKVVATCETKGQTVKGVMETWDIDSFGQTKSSNRASPEKDMPMTPSSLDGSRLKRPLVPKQPSLMDGNCVMKPFQLFGLNWMRLLYNYDIGCILADEMGLGKTCQVISLLCELVEAHENRPSGRRPWPNLVVVPPSTYNNWLIEFEKFAPGLSVIGYRGSQAERSDIAYEVEHNRADYHVVLATYSQINTETDVEAMQSFGLNAAIFDEGHKMKNPSTKLYRDLSRIPSSWKMLLTGTPVQNNLMEMTALLNFINPKMFDGYLDDITYIFSQKVTVKDVSNGAFLYTERVRRARTILEPFILQRRKDQVLSDMPPKISSVVYCDLDKDQRETYLEYEEKFKNPAARKTIKKDARGNDQNNVWIQMRKAALHPMLFRRHFTDKTVAKMASILMDRLDQSELQQPDLGHLTQELKNASDFELHLWCRDYPRLLKEFDVPDQMLMRSGKVVKLVELLKGYQKTGDRVLVFSKFSRVIEMLQEVLALENIDHRVLSGSTDVSERQELIDEFNTDTTIPAFLLTTGAGGTGINLTSANKVVIFDMSDNPQDDIQAENRAHRLGQTREVEIVRLLGRDTVEELIYSACLKKIELATRVTGGQAAAEEVEDEAEMKGGEMEREVRRMMAEGKATTT